MKILNAIKLVTRAFKVMDKARLVVVTLVLQAVESTPSDAIKFPPRLPIHRTRGDKLESMNKTMMKVS